MKASFCRACCAISVLLVTASMAGCQVSLLSPVSPSAELSSLAPEYNYPLVQFRKADPKVIGSEFIDQYAGQYVVFEAVYVGTSDTVFIQLRGDQRKAMVKDLQEVTLYAGSVFQLIGCAEDRDIRLPLVALAGQQKTVRVFAYILPAGKEWKCKSQINTYRRGFAKPVPILIKVEDSK
jgi:hypothetical protein